MEVGDEVTDGGRGGVVRQAATTGAVRRLTGSAGLFGRGVGSGVSRRGHAQGRDRCEAQEHTHAGDVVHFIFHNFSSNSAC